MPNETKEAFLTELRKRFGYLRKLEHSNSLYDVGNGDARIYIRYSKVHARNSAFYGLRREDLQTLQGHPSLVCFLCEGREDPLFIRFADYEDIFQSLTPASDGQFKAQIYFRNGAAELCLARAGRFNLEGQVGWQDLEDMLRTSGRELVPDLSHSQVQTLLSAIGTMKGFDIWIPQNDRGRVDGTLGTGLKFRDAIPPGLEPIADIAQEIDVIWMDRGSNMLSGLFEVEHSTPIYSALLRFNDVHLSRPSPQGNFQIVANDMRRGVFVRQLSRPTFRSSGLNELCGFLEYRNVFGWYQRLKGAAARE
jgi:hypothetical protein